MAYHQPCTRYFPTSGGVDEKAERGGNCGEFIDMKQLYSDVARLAY